MTGVLLFDISAVPASIKNIFANAGGYYCFSICLFVLFLSLFSRSVHNKTGVKKKNKNALKIKVTEVNQRSTSKNQSF